MYPIYTLFVTSNKNAQKFKQVRFVTAGVNHLISRFQKKNIFNHFKII